MHCASDIHTNWNSIVTPHDIVVVNGDVALDEEWLVWMALLNGRKILIRGNYDKMSDEVYHKYFEIILDAYDTVIEGDDGKGGRTDLPVHVVHYPSKGVVDRFNIVGHIHATWRVQKNMLNVGVDAHHFRPISADQVLFFYRGINEFYDQDVWVGNHPSNLAHDSRGKPGTYWQTGFTGSHGETK